MNTTGLLGHFSYSIYLVHYPLLVLIWNLTLPVQSSPSVRAALLFGLGTPLMLACSYLSHLAFERRFMPGLVGKAQAALAPAS